jgi:hypothetical protein
MQIPLDKAVRNCLKAIDDNIARASGSEREVLEAFANEIDARLYGINMRIEELREEE